MVVHKKENGFTLIETMFVVSFLTVLIVLGFSVIRTSSQSLESSLTLTQERANVSRVIQGTLDFVGQDKSNTKMLGDSTLTNGTGSISLVNKQVLMTRNGTIDTLGNSIDNYVVKDSTVFNYKSIQITCTSGGYTINTYISLR